MSAAPSPREREILDRLQKGKIGLSQAFGQLRQIRGDEPEPEKPLPPPPRRPRRQPRRRFRPWQTIELLAGHWRRSKKNAAPPTETVPAKPRYGLLYVAEQAGLELIAVGLLLGAILVLIGPILFKSGFQGGSDTPAHIYIAKRLAEGISSTGRLPAIDLHWYSGFEITHKLPLLSYVWLVITYLLTNDAMLTSRIFYVLALVAMALIVYTVFRLAGGARAGALATALVVPFVPASIDWGVGIISSYTRFFAFLFFPIAFYCTKRLMDGGRTYWLYLGIVISLIFPSHAMVALIAIMWLSVYALLRIVLERKPFLSIRFLIYAYLLSIVLAAWYILPFALEGPGLGASVPVQVLSVPGISLNPQAQLNHWGWVFMISAVAALTIKFTRPRLALFVTCLIGYVFALGVYGPILKILPSLGFSYPYLAYFPSTFGLAWLIFDSLPATATRADTWAARLKNAGFGIALLLLAATIVYESALTTHFTRLTTRGFLNQETNLSREIRRRPPAGRVLPMGPPIVNEVFALTMQTNQPTPEGWYASITPFFSEITAMYDDVLKGYHGAALRKLRRWNVGAVALTPFLKQRKDFKGRDFEQALRDAGFTRTYQNPSFRLFAGNSPGYVQEFRENTLIVGKFGQTAEALWPQSIYTQKSLFIDDYTLAELSRYKTLVLYGFSFKNQARAERLLKNYVAGGGKVVLDMQSIDEYSRFRNKSLFGVRVGNAKFSGRTRLAVEDAPAVGAASLKQVDFPKNWQAVYYRGLDRVYIKALNKRRRLAIAGYKNIGPGKIYFIGGNLLYYAFDKRDATVAKFAARVIGGSGPRAASKPETLKITRFKPESMVFKYRSKKPWPALISRAYSPHWYATLDGSKELPLNKTEGLIELYLPRGNHTVELVYGSTLIHPVSIAVSVIGVFFTVLMFRAYRRTGMKKQPDASGEENEHT